MSLTTPLPESLPSHSALINGETLSSAHGPEYAHIYPGNGTVSTALSLATSADVDQAVKAAQQAFPAWRALSGDRRRDLLLTLASVIENHGKALAQLELLGSGNPIMMASYIPSVIAQRFRYYAGAADRIRGETLSVWNGPAHNYVNLEPYGVVGAIIPWNGPMFAAAMVMAPALAAGNCVVIKAPELSPFSVMRLSELFAEAGFPPGVVNMVVGGPDVGEALVAHPGIAKVQFVGSGRTAKQVLTTAAQNLTPCGLELGGKSAVLLFGDCDLAEAGKRALSGAISVSGQGCVNGTRLLVERTIYEPFLQLAAGMAAHIPVGDPAAPGTVMGPVISEASLQRIQSTITQAQADGARLITGGERIGGDLADGYFLPITVLADVDPQSELARNEVFGPVLCVTPFDSEDEAIALANDSDYGLGAYIHTNNLRRAHHVAAAMEAGMVQVNAAGEGMQPFAPFGGYKQSGFGRLGGQQGLLEFLQVKNIWMNLAPGSVS